MDANDGSMASELEPSEVASDAADVIDVLVHQDVLASIMAQLGLRGGLRAAAVCTAWRLAALASQEEQRVLRPSHSLGWGNEALGQFRSPSGIIVLPSGELCVADTNNHRLQILSRSGDVTSVVGHGPASGSGDFQQPTGLACDGKYLYVADSGNCADPPHALDLRRRTASPLSSSSSFVILFLFSCHGSKLTALHHSRPSAPGRLHKLSLPDLKPVATIGSFGEGAGQV